MEPSNYDEAFFATQIDESQRSADVVVPCLLDLLGPVRSVLDVGGGSGAWASVWLKHDVDAICVDGDYVPSHLRQVPGENFRAHDLTLPLDLGRKFDLVTCLEVAEHLPRDKAGTLVESIARHGDMVCFSAALPGQGGEHHINEQWPSWWRAIWESRGFRLYDIVRSRLWNDERVGFWFRQNILVYARGDACLRLDGIPKEGPVDLVHPGQWTSRINSLTQPVGIRHAAALLAGAVYRKLSR